MEFKSTESDEGCWVKLRREEGMSFEDEGVSKDEKSSVEELKKFEELELSGY